MHDYDKDMKVRVDGYTRFCLTAIAILLTITVIGLWSEAFRSNEALAAQPFADTSAQREALLAVQKQTNAKLDSLIDMFKSGQAKVQVTRMDPSALGTLGVGGENVDIQKSK